MDASRKALFQSPHVSSVETTLTATTPLNNNPMILATIELENGTQFCRTETEKELHNQRLQKIRENIQSLSVDAWLYQDPDKLIGFQRVTTHWSESKQNLQLFVLQLLKKKTQFPRNIELIANKFSLNISFFFSCCRSNDELFSIPRPFTASQRSEFLSRT